MAHWSRPQPSMTPREVYDELWARRRRRGIDSPPPMIVEPEPCEQGCQAGTLWRVKAGLDVGLLGALICSECGTVYRRDTPTTPRETAT